MIKIITLFALLSPLCLISCGSGLSVGVNSIPYNPMGQNEPTKLNKLRGAKGASYIVRLGNKYKNMKIPDLQGANKNDTAKDLIAISDYNYQNYEGGLLAGKGKRGFAFDSSSFLLSTASSVFGSSSTKTVLSALSAGVQSTQTGIDKHLFSEQSIDVIITRMRLLRKQKLVKIKTDLKKNSYDTRDLLIDMQHYYRAGTVSSAIQDILQEAAANTNTETIKEDIKLKAL